MTEKEDAPVQPKPAEANGAKASKAQQEREAEFHRTHRVPPGFTFSVFKGLHKTPKKDK